MYPIDVSNDYFTDVSLGNVSGPFFVNQLATKENLSQVAFETVWGNGQGFGNKVWLDSAERMSVVSDSVNDAPGGTGASAIRVFGVDQNGDRLIEVVTLNGTSPVLTTGLFLAINDVAVVDGAVDLFGSDGNITLTSEVTGHVQNHVNPDSGRSTGGFFKVPNGFNAVVKSVVISTTKNDEVVLIPYIRFSSDTPFIAQSFLKTEVATTPLLEILRGLPEGAELELRAKGLTPNANVAMTFSLYVEPTDNIQPIR
jgi:hypothetical protein